MSGETRRIAGRLRKGNLSCPRLHFDAAGRDRLRELARSTHSRYADQLFDGVERNKKMAWLKAYPELHTVRAEPRFQTLPDQLKFPG